MNAELQALKQKRLKWVESNRENGFDEGINRLLTELYPDNAHFIYELLQNAEDPQATTVHFRLTESDVTFSHNGKRLFDFKDVESITSIGNSTKRDDETTIGKFGVGFKAVFAYTNTPEIHSGDYHFRIHDLVVPETEGVVSDQVAQWQTRFIFPFDNTNKSARTARDEIEKGLFALGDNTLLFLNHIRKIEYELPDGSIGSLQRINHKDGRIEIRVIHPNNEQVRSYWLCFQKNVHVKDEDGKIKDCRVAVAYKLQKNEANQKTQSDWKIVPVDGEVSIYFPAEKESSKLHFHIHAPFASTVARDSVRDCQASEQLRYYLGDLIVESFSTIKKQGMLNMSFLAVLPNSRDNLTEFYKPLFLAVCNAFNQQSLTPTKTGKHAKARILYRGPVKISEIINDKDLRILTNDDNALWSANPPQRNQREDNFLDNLEIKKWDFDQLSAIFQEERTDEIDSWLLKKNDSWLLSFYALLHEAMKAYESVQNKLFSSQRKAWPGKLFPLVRVVSDTNVSHVLAEKAFFRLEENRIIPPAGIEIVKPSVYKVGKNNSEDAESFLKKLGVRPFDEKAAIELRISKYQNLLPEASKEHYNDIRQFVEYFKKTHDITIFQCNSFLLDVTAEKWKSSDELCLDVPFVDSGLADLVEVHGKSALWQGYSDNLNETELQDFLEFAQGIGVLYKLEVMKLTEAEARKNSNAPGGNWTHTGVASDYSINNLDKFLAVKKLSASRLIWNAILVAPKEAGSASFKPNQQYSVKYVESQLVLHLKNYPWIFNSQNEFCTPGAMTHEMLRGDFPFDDRNGLLTKLEFGTNARLAKQIEEQNTTRQNRNDLDRQQAMQNIAQDMGLDSADELCEWVALGKELGGIDVIRSLIAQRNSKNSVDLPDRNSNNPERRAVNVEDKAHSLPNKEQSNRPRTVTDYYGPSQQDARQYLISQYQDGEVLICQICQQEQPVKVNDKPIFHAVDCISGLDKFHNSNNLCLCPNHSEMYKKSDLAADTIISLILDLKPTIEKEQRKLNLDLGGNKVSLYFTQNHLSDLQAVIRSTNQK